MPEKLPANALAHFEGKGVNGLTMLSTVIIKANEHVQNRTTMMFTHPQEKLDFIFNSFLVPENMPEQSSKVDMFPITLTPCSSQNHQEEVSRTFSPD